MRLPDDNTKYSSLFKYVEVAVFIPPCEDYPKGVLARKVKGKKGEGSDPFLFSEEEIKDIAAKNNNEGIYTSIFQYNSKDFSSASYMSSLYFDLDSQDLSQSLEDSHKLYEYLIQYVPDDAIRIYFSGGKGFHIECEAICLNTGTSEDLSNIYSFIAHTLAEELDISSMDFQVYDIRRMWRLPNTRHQKSGLFKVPCKDLIKANASIGEIQDWASQPREEEVPEQVFNPHANFWYREFVYKFEQDKLIKTSSQQDLLSRFLEQGSGGIRESFDLDKRFDQFKLFKNCPAARDLVNKANSQHHLEHYERLFLCSLLTYTTDAIDFLHKTLSQCTDYNFEVTNSHIQDWIKRREYGIGGRPFTCTKAKQVGIMCSSCDGMEPKKKIITLGNNKYIETEEFSAPSPIRHTYTIPKGKL